jgi:hypothetical protein
MANIVKRNMREISQKKRGAENAENGDEMGKHHTGIGNDNWPMGQPVCDGGARGRKRGA